MQQLNFHDIVFCKLFSQKLNRESFPLCSVSSRNVRVMEQDAYLVEINFLLKCGWLHI